MAVAIISIYKIITLWAIDPKETYIFIFFAVVSLAMFNFRRKYRRRFEAREKEKDNPK